LQVLARDIRSKPVLPRRTGEAENMAASALRGRVILVDDEPLFRQALCENLADAGFETVEFECGPSMLEHLKTNSTVDLIILDWKMPKMNGIDVLKHLRRDGYTMPVIFLTGLSHAAYEEAALTGGAVDFIEKSRGFAILLKRAELSLKRARSREKRFGATMDEAATGTLKIGHLALSLDTNTASWKGNEVSLTASEFKMVRLMAERAGDHVPYGQLYDVVLSKHSTTDGEKADIEMNVRTFIKRIRRGFVDVDACFDCIENYAKFGYRWRK
jgi:two-component system response regulator ChvI